jgi:hypothetical protein
MFLYHLHPDVPSALSAWQQQQQRSSEVRVPHRINQFSFVAGYITFVVLRDSFESST